jgi:hypothetical protein
MNRFYTLLRSLPAKLEEVSMNKVYHLVESSDIQARTYQHEQVLHWLRALIAKLGDLASYFLPSLTAKQGSARLRPEAKPEEANRFSC